MIWWSDSASGVVPVGERPLKKDESCSWSTVAPAAVTKPYASVHSERHGQVTALGAERSRQRVRGTTQNSSPGDEPGLT